MKRKTLFRTLSWFSAVIALFAAGVGCARKDDTPPSVERPVLRLGYTPSEEAVADREEAMRALAAYLERQMVVKVELVRTGSYGPAVEAMSRGEIDVIGLAPFAYVLASRKGVAEVLVATGDAEGTPRHYQSVLIAHKRAGISDLDEFSKSAARLRLCFSDPASNSGYLVPQALLAALNLDASNQFSSIEFTLSHSVSIFNVLFDHADVAGVSANVLARLQTKGRVPENELVRLWTSEFLPSGPIAVRRALPADLKHALREALLALPIRDPEASRTVMAQYQTRGMVYVRAEDSLYDGLRGLAQSVRREGMTTAK
jgi:phosphonate transport system substrate-binding protein